MPEIYNSCNDIVGKFPDVFSCKEMEMPAVLSEIYKGIGEKEEVIINSVLKEFLRREPIIEDYKKCCKAYHVDDEPSDYHFSYDGISLGKVSFAFHGPKITITFTPYAGNI